MNGNKGIIFLVRDSNFDALTKEEEREKDPDSVLPSSIPILLVWENLAKCVPMNRVLQEIGEVRDQ
jgi:hypothetical protein